MNSNFHAQRPCRLSVVMPALNESRTVGAAVREAALCLKKMALEDQSEIIVADNASEDRTREIAEAEGARVVVIPKRGYGHALLGGFKAARGDYIVAADADGSYDFGHIERFYARLVSGSEFVMGNRFLGRIHPGAMPFAHRYFGTPLLSFLMNFFHHTQLGDVTCGMRALRRSSLDKMSFQTGDMGFCVEMVLRAARAGIKIEEVPCDLRPDGRAGRPHLRTWQDGLRCIYMILFSTPLPEKTAPRGK